MSSIIPIERFICYKQNDRKRKVPIYVDSEYKSKEPIVTDYFDNSYKLVFIKQYAEDGKNPEMELVLDGTTKYNIKYYDRDNRSVETLENVSFNYIMKDSIQDYPKYKNIYKNILDQYCVNFELGPYKKELNYLTPYETDEEVIYYYKSPETGEINVDYVDIPYIVPEYSIAIQIANFHFANEETEIKFPINGTRFVNYLKKNNVNTHVFNGAFFIARIDSNGNIVWDILNVNQLIISINNANLNDLGIEIDGDVSEGDLIIIKFRELFEDSIYIDSILDIEEVKE